MMKIYSKIDNSLLLHAINRFAEIQKREDLCDPEEFIQCATLKMDKGKTFKPHKHIEKSRKYDNKIAQESWVVMQGKVKVFFYDIDDTVIETCILEKGDASFTFRGGHNYLILEDDTIVYEYKTGPCEGQEHDKEFI